ncbi:MAG: hypothetical protein WD426_00165 [Anditalea sp.]
MKKLNIFPAIAFTSLLLLGCSSSTEITASWKAPEADPAGYQDLFIAALTEDLSARQNLEEEFTSMLNSSNVNTVESIKTFRPDFLDEGAPEREDLLKIIQETDVDGILTVTFIDTKEEKRYVPAGPTYAPIGRFGYYGDFHGYFNNWYGNSWNTGYYTTDKEYFIETNLYDANDLKLVWSGQSRTYDSSDLNVLAMEYVDAIKEELLKEGLIGQQ